MKNINDFIIENISDNFTKKYKDSINGRYVSKIENSAWSVYQREIKNIDKYNRLVNYKNFLKNTDQTENDFIKVYSELWYTNQYGDPENYDLSSVIVADYCFKKYNVKIFDCRTVGDSTERHFFISYVPGDSNKRKGIMCPFCEVQCQFDTGDGGWHGKNSTIHWNGDIDSVEEYAKMVLDYIKQCFD